MIDPDQLAVVEPRVAPRPEQALLACVLEQALLDLRTFSKGQRAEHRAEVRAIRAWIESDDPGATMRGFSFLYICEHLSIDPEWVRERYAKGGRKGTKESA